MGMNELLVYAGALITGMILFALATSTTGGVLENAMKTMDVQQSRYESLARSYTYVAQGVNYNFTYSEATSDINDASGEDYCVYNQGRTEFTLLVPGGFKEMHVFTSDKGPITNTGSFGCKELFPFHPESEDKNEDYITYPPIFFSVDKPGGPEREVDSIRTSTANSKK